MSKKSNKVQTETSETKKVELDETEVKEDEKSVVNETTETITTNEGVAPSEGDNSIDETEVKEDEKSVVNETTDIPQVSVVDVQESVEDIKEDNTATINEEVIVKEEPVVDRTTYEGGFYVTLGNVPKEKVNLSKERIAKAGYKAIILDDGEIAVGPYEDEATVITVRKRIVSKGLKGRIVKK